ncbi:MAG: phosphatidylserine decarboxylase [Gammaproteobacteria bacterium]|nr:phosphatidylserine decarboxylase [Gammaproteobacteria bacterium]
MRRLARVRAAAIKNTLIRRFIARYRVDMTEALQADPAAYPDFNAFFTRALVPGARPIVSGAGEIACPADGVVSQAGRIEQGRLLQAKGIDYTLESLLGDDGALADRFLGGSFATVYLSPRDYHRVHMPLAGVLADMRYIPGRLFSVNDYSTRHVRGLFARNERLVTLFETETGPMTVILVGAFFVAGIETVWAGEVSRERPHGRWQRQPAGHSTPVELGHGEEMGRFNMGSTVIVLFGPGRVRWTETLVPGTKVRMGELMGRVMGDG